VVDGVDEMRKAVREELRQGAHQIKLFVSGGVTSPTDPIWMNQFTDEEIQVAVYEANTRHRYVMAHCHTDEAVRRCVALGVRTIEHGTDISAETAELIAEAGAYVVPTLSIVDVALANKSKLDLCDDNLKKLEGIYEKMLVSIAICQKAGVRLGLGSDIQGREFHRKQGSELRLRGSIEKAVDVLRSATSINAEILQMEGELGCIRAGALADILVLDFNPFDDLSGFENPQKNIAIIMKDGKFIRNSLKEF
jgi:imidazolonepropionase-like amidohydrolase